MAQLGTGFSQAAEIARLGHPRRQQRKHANGRHEKIQGVRPVVHWQGCTLQTRLHALWATGHRQDILYVGHRRRHEIECVLFELVR